MTKFIDYYRVLGVEPDADKRDIRLAYVRHAKENHPDVGGSHDQMQLFNRAYETLVDDKKRAAYDKIHRMETVGIPDAYRVSGGHGSDRVSVDMSDDEIDDFMNSVFAEYANKPAEPPIHKKAASAVKEQLRKRKRKAS